MCLPDGPSFGIFRLFDSNVYSSNDRSNFGHCRQRAIIGATSYDFCTNWVIGWTNRTMWSKGCWIMREIMIVIVSDDFTTLTSLWTRHIDEVVNFTVVHFKHGLESVVTRQEKLCIHPPSIKWPQSIINFIKKAQQFVPLGCIYNIHNHVKECVDELPTIFVVHHLTFTELFNFLQIHIDNFIMSIWWLLLLQDKKYEPLALTFPWED